MSDIIPKLKLYLVLTLVTVFINLGCIFTVFAIDDTKTIKDDLDIGGGEVSINTGLGAIGTIASLGLAVIPFASMFPITTLNIDSIALFILEIGVGIISMLQLLILIFMGMQLISNLIWHPDV